MNSHILKKQTASIFS